MKTSFKRLKENYIETLKEIIFELEIMVDFFFFFCYSSINDSQT